MYRGNTFFSVLAALFAGATFIMLCVLVDYVSQLNSTYTNLGEKVIVVEVTPKPELSATPSSFLNPLATKSASPSAKKRQ
jgi:hypothetical protein